MTVADWIRSMADEELAALFTTILSERDRATVEKLAAQGIQTSLVEMPAVSMAKHLQFLQSPAENI